MKRIVFLGATMLAASVSVASATTFNEIGDAGNALATAQAVAAGTTQIAGTLGFSGDTDLFAFSLAAPTTLTIDGLGWAMSGIDSNLLLFDGLGHGIEGDDDGGSATLESRISVGLGIGDYLIGYGDNNTYAYTDGSTSFMSNDSGYVGLTSERLGYLYGGYRTGSYLVNFSQAVGSDIAPVPLPAGLPLLLGGLGALALAARGKRRA